MSVYRQGLSNMFGFSQDLSNSSLAREGKAGEFEWDQNQRGLLLGSYYYGYTVMQVKY